MIYKHHKFSIIWSCKLKNHQLLEGFNLAQIECSKLHFWYLRTSTATEDIMDPFRLPDSAWLELGGRCTANPRTLDWRIRIHWIPAMGRKMVSLIQGQVWHIVYTTTTHSLFFSLCNCEINTWKLEYLNIWIIQDQRRKPNLHQSKWN